jgi:hypothetical protein
MWNFVKDHGELIVAGTVGLFGLGKLWQKQADSEKRIVKLEESEPMTLSHCKDRQDLCHQVQIVQNSAIKEDINELRESLRDMKKCNDTQHDNLLERGDKQHTEIMTHLLK